MIHIWKGKWMVAFACIICARLWTALRTHSSINGNRILNKNMQDASYSFQLHHSVHGEEESARWQTKESLSLYSTSPAAACPSPPGHSLWASLVFTLQHAPRPQGKTDRGLRLESQESQEIGYVYTESTQYSSWRWVDLQLQVHIFLSPFSPRTKP